MTPFDLGDMPALTADGGETGPGTSDQRPGPRVDATYASYRAYLDTLPVDEFIAETKTTQALIGRRAA
ncbi:hypothetical protein AB0J20_16485 [Micromonospora costi]|uniref:hypothetical protein n=1 Tax=Micromonospora costi TaxID=1530042 RepID=UPI0033D287CA